MDSFWAKVKYTETCWLWQGNMTSAGYGLTRSGGKNISAHRFIYALTKEPLIDGLQIDHLCRVKNCVNPEHLEQVTPKENVLRAIPFRNKYVPSAKRSHCRQGHRYTKANTILLNVGGKICAKCNED